MRAAIDVNDTPGMRAGDVEDQNFLLLGDLDNFESGSVEKCGAGRRLTGNQRRVLGVGSLAIRVDGSGPILKGHLIGSGHAAEARPDLPVAFLLRSGPEIHVAIGPSRSGFYRLRRGGAGRGFFLLGANAGYQAAQREAPHEPVETRRHVTSSAAFRRLSAPAWYFA